VPALLECPLDGTQANNGQRAGRAADDGVKLVQAVGQIPQTHHLTAKAPGQLLPALQCAVGDGNGLWVFGREVRGAQLNHFARADKQYVDPAQVLKQIACQPHGRCRHADRVGTDFGGRAHFLGDRERSLKQLRQCRAQCAGSIGRAYGVLELPQNLGLTQDHRVQPAGHPESVPRGVTVLQAVGVGAQGVRRNSGRLG